MESLHLTILGAVIGLGFVVSRLAIFGWMLRVPEQTPTTRRIARAVRSTQHASRVLVPVQGTALSDRMVALGCQMAKARDARIEVFYVIEMPWTLPLNASLPAEDRLAADELDRARRIAARYGVTLETRVANTREAGRAIVDEAITTGADIILMGDVPRKRGGTRFSDTTTYVFTHAPCEVVIDRPALDGAFRENHPEGASRGG